jgi:hypothetical protein
MKEKTCTLAAKEYEEQSLDRESTADTKHPKEQNKKTCLTQLAIQVLSTTLIIADIPSSSSSYFEIR